MGFRGLGTHYVPSPSAQEAGFFAERRDILTWQTSATFIHLAAVILQVFLRVIALIDFPCL